MSTTDSDLILVILETTPETYDLIWKLFFENLYFNGVKFDRNALCDAIYTCF